MSFNVVKLVDPIQMTISGTFTPKGAYAAGTDYAVGDSVDYNGSSYVMYVDAAAGTLPTDTTKWQVLANKGDTGETATNHALLNNLAYADSGHTGFEPAKGADDNYVTDAEKVVIGNTSGTNTGDQDLSAYQLEPSEGAFVDGDKTKLDGIEALADVTDATNVAAAGAIMDGDITGNGLVTRTGAGAYTNRTITGTANQVTVTNGDGVSGNPTLSLPQNIDTSATPTFSSLTAGTATDVLGTALSVIRNNVAVGRIDNNASGLRVQAQNGSLQLRGTGNTGIAIDASGNAVVAGTITGANLSGTNTGDNATNSQYSGLDAAKVNKAGDTMTGNLNMGTNKLIGGTGVADVLKLQGTTGNGTATSAAIQLLTGNNGATTALTVLNSGNVGVGTATPVSPLQVNASHTTYLSEIWLNSGTANSGPYLRLGASSSYPNYIGSQFGAQAWAGLGLIMRDNANQFVAHGGNIRLSTSAQSTKKDVAYTSKVDGTKTFLFTADADIWGTYPGSTFTIGANTYTVKAAASDRIAVLEDISGEAATGTLTGVSYTPTRMNIGTNGVVGINNTDLTSRFSVSSASAADVGQIIRGSSAQTGDLLRFYNSANNTLSVFDSAGKLGIGTATPGAQLQVTAGAATTIGQIIRGASAQTADLLQIQDSSANKLMVVSSGGNVGIGTTSPSDKLHVASAKILSPTLMGLTIQDTTSSALGVGGGFSLYGNYTGTSTTIAGAIDAYKTNATAGNWDFDMRFQTRENSTSGLLEVMRLTANRRVGIGTATPSAILNTSIAGGIEPTLVHASNSSLTLTRNAGSELAFTISANSPFTASLQHRNAASDSSSYPIALNPLGGNVGIGTTAPSEKLDVSGTVKATGYKSSDGSAGVSGSFTTTDGKTITIKDGLVVSIV